MLGSGSLADEISLLNDQRVAPSAEHRTESPMCFT